MGQRAEPLFSQLPSSGPLQAMSPYALTQEFFVQSNPSRVIEFSPDASLICLGRGNPQLDFIELATCSAVATTRFRSAPSAVLWKYSTPNLLIVGLRDGSFTTITVNRDFEVTFGQVYRPGTSVRVSAIAMSDVHGILAVATGPIVHIYRFEQGSRESPFPSSVASH